MRNEAIDLANLSILLCGHNGFFPLWTHLAKAILTMHPLKSDNVDPTATINPFLQNWNPKTCDLPFFLQSMMKTARKYGVAFDGISPTGPVSSTLPIWHHLHEDNMKRQVNRGKLSCCLHNKHQVFTVGEAVTVSTRLNQLSHQQTNICNCFDCSTDCTQRLCTDPHACATAARRKLDGLVPKWDPRRAPIHFPTPNPATPLAASVSQTHLSVFDPSLDLSSFEEGFRVFTKWDTPPLTVIPPLP